MARFTKGVFDEYGCFNIIDFQRGDNIIVTNRKKERIKGIVISTTSRPATIIFSDVNGEQRTARLNDVTFLQPPVPGWLEK